MLEALISVAIAGIAGGAALNNRLHQRINNVHDRISGLDRIDAIELGVAQDYVSKADLSVMTKTYGRPYGTYRKQIRPNRLT